MLRTIARRTGVDRGIGWIRAAERACAKLAPQDVDLILATGEPYSAFMVAKSLSKKLNRPYVLDYRDPWTEPGMVKSSRPLVVRLEASLLKNAAAIVTVSESWARDLDVRFGVGSKSHVVTNGYDAEELESVKPHEFGHFAIVYAGIFYPPDRVITPVLESLKRVPVTGSREWYFHYYGDHGKHVEQEAARLGVADRVKLHGKVNRSEALSAVMGANIAVVIASVKEEANGRIKGWIPAKLYETVGLGTPVLLIAPPGSDVGSIADGTGLVHRFTGNDVHGTAEFISEMMSGRVAKKRSVHSFAWDCIGKRLDGLLRKGLVPSKEIQAANFSEK
jgi:glycosyltransferase involved in cell wall biosynthesis